MDRDWVINIRDSIDNLIVLEKFRNSLRTNILSGARLHLLVTLEIESQKHIMDVPTRR